MAKARMNAADLPPMLFRVLQRIIKYSIYTSVGV